MATRRELREEVEAVIGYFEALFSRSAQKRMNLRLSNLFGKAKDASYRGRPGIYIIYGFGRILYVGQSLRSVGSRIAKKEKEAGERITKYQTLTVEEDMDFLLLALERLLIDELEPELNRA